VLAKAAASKLDASENAYRELGSEGKTLVSVVVTTRNRVNSLIRCLASIYSNDYQPIEVIVVDDNSSVDIAREVVTTFPKAKIIINSTRRLLAASRNLGAAASFGKYIFFVDDDNVLDKLAIRSLVRTLINLRDVGVVAPLTYYLDEPSRLWWAGARVGRISSIVAFPHKGQSGVHPRRPYLTDQFHNAFMVRREVFNILGGFDVRFFPIYLSEADFAERMQGTRQRAVVVPDSKVYHDVPVELRRASIREMHITEPLRAYYVARNRTIYMRLHRKAGEFLIFVFLFAPVVFLTHLLSILRSPNVDRSSLIRSYLKGVIDGLALSELRRTA
jgi:GT2 family glycosyltransferase